MAKKNVEKNPESREEALANASAVEAITHTEGWKVLREDMAGWQDQLLSQLLYLDPESPEAKRLKILAIAVHQLPLLIANYSLVKEQIEKDIVEGENKDMVIPKYWDGE